MSITTTHPPATHTVAPTPSAPPAVALTGLTKSFGAVHAVRSLHLRIDGGGTVAVLGRNGAGKSTTINMLLGLLPPDAGEVRIHGMTPERASAAGRVGAMLQETQPIPQLKVRELLSFLVCLYPHPMAVAELLDLADLTAVADRETAKLSGGQMQRLKFAMAVAGRPDLLVLDEPTAAMDVESRRAFWAAMREYTGEGRTVVFTTHYIEEADDAADRIVVVDAGTTVADGTPAQIRAAVGRQRVTIARPAEAAALDDLPGVVEITPAGARVHLHTTDADACVLALARRGLVHDLEVSAASLEDAFVALTTRRA